MAVPVSIRPATKDDVKALAKVHVAGWRSSYEHIVDKDFLDSRSVDEQAKKWNDWFDEGKVTALIAETEEGEAVGLSSFGKLRTPIPGQSPIRPLYTGELYAIYILPDCWRQGIGRRLMGETAKALKEMKHKSMALWVLDKNKRAQKFYKALGGQRCGKSQIEIGGKDLKEVCFGWRKTDELMGLL